MVHEAALATSHPMKIFITGATGLLGSSLLVHFSSNNHEIWALSRKSKTYSEKSITWVKGTLESINDWKNHLKNADVAMHAAALTEQGAPKNDYWEINVDGTRNFLLACRELKVPKIILISTANVFGFGSLEQPGIELNPAKYPFTESWYAQSKISAHNLIQEFSDLFIVSIHPTFMIGEQTGKITSSNQIFHSLVGKKIAFFPSGGKNFIGITDVVHGIEKAIEHGKRGESYLLSDQNLSYHDFFTIAAEINCQKTKLIPIPNRFIRALSWIAKRFLRHSKINPVNLEIIQVKNFYCSSKAQMELHWKPQFFLQDLQKAIDSYKKRGKKNP